MGRQLVHCRGASPTPYSMPEPKSDFSQILVKKTVTKEKTSNWIWGRASQASSVSSVTEPARSASPARVARYRSDSHHRHHHSRQHSHHHSHPKALDHHDEHRRHGRHRRRHSEDAPHIEDKKVVHLSCHYQRKHSLPTGPQHTCPPPILLAVTIKPSRKMEEVGGFSYEEWCKRRECVPVPTETIAPKSSISNRSTHSQSAVSSDHDNAYRYVAMREPGPQDAVPVAYALYPQPGYTYMYPPQPFAAMAAPQALAPAPPAPAPSTHSKKEESHYHHYVRERVHEKSVRPASEPPTIEKAVSAQSASKANLPAMTYGAIPYGMPAAAIPVAYAMPNYPVPVHTETASTSSPKPKTDRVWVGRTKKQVDEDNAKIAHKEGVYKPNEMVPKAASPDQLFWVIEPDDSNTLRTFRTIEEELQPGKWKVDPRYGNAYFVRDKQEKAKK